MPTLATLKSNGKLDLIQYPEPKDGELIIVAPQKPLSAYQIYMKQMREKISSPDGGVPLCQLIQQRWNEESYVERQEYEMLAKEEKRRYDLRLAKFHEWKS